MKRKIIRIDTAKCNGCGACAAACHEGAIGMVNGVAKLLREDYCDGLGDCLPACPTGAITFEERDALAYNAAAVQQADCPGSRTKAISQQVKVGEEKQKVPSRLAQWPCQIKLVPVHAPYLEGANLLIAADCSAFAYGNFHQEFMRNHITLIGCPKLDGVDYTEKLAMILAENEILSLTVVRMEVPCCGGLELAAKRALQKSGKRIPWRVITISTDGKILD